MQEDMGVYVVKKHKTLQQIHIAATECGKGGGSLEEKHDWN
jgi:hypothetical protein